jgi:hypothetical protein
MMSEGEIESLREQLKDLKTQKDAELLLKDAELLLKDAEIRSKYAELESLKAQLVTPRLSESRVDLSAEVTEAAQDSTATSTNLGSNFSHECFLLNVYHRLRRFI